MKCWLLKYVNYKIWINCLTSNHICLLIFKLSDGDKNFWEDKYPCWLFWVHNFNLGLLTSSKTILSYIQNKPTLHCQSKIFKFVSVRNEVIVPALKPVHVHYCQTQVRIVQHAWYSFCQKNMCTTLWGLWTKITEI